MPRRQGRRDEQHHDPCRDRGHRARARKFPGLVIAGKTGTTNNSTNAWFNAFTGNLVGSVWFGNDDGSPMGDMTGGTLPALSWHDIMAYAHRNLEPKPPFGVAAPPGRRRSPTRPRARRRGAGERRRRAATLAPQTSRALLEIAEFLRAAQSRAEAAPAPRRTGVANAAAPPSP